MNRAIFILFVGVWCLLTTGASAQWVTESYPLKAGYHAIWLAIDCSDRSIEDILEDYPQIEEMWQWNADASATQFDQQPLVPMAPDSQWRVWKRDGLAVEQTLSLLTANAAYLVKVAPGDVDFDLQLKGRPVAPDYFLKSSGVNLLGFPTVSATSFTNFFGFSEVLRNSPPVFYYDGEATATSKRLTTPNSKFVVRGHAYWVKTDRYSDYYGPLQVKVLSAGGIDFGTKLSSATLRVKNVTDPAKKQDVTVTFALEDSAEPPSGGGIPTAVELRVRGPRDENLEFTYSTIAGHSVLLAPGEEKEIILDANRVKLATPGKDYAGILRVTDSLGQTRIDLPVSATGSSRDGLWVGAAILNAVNQVEAIRGPEFDAPVEAVDGESEETESVIVETRTTGGGVATEETVFDARFDGDGKATLHSAGASGVEVEGPLVFDPGFDAELEAGAYVPSVTVQASDGKIIVGGSFETIGGASRFGLGRFGVDGLLEPGFDLRVNPEGERGLLVGVQADGKILFGGMFGASVVEGFGDGLGRLNGDGSVDVGFRSLSGGDYVTALVVQENGKILVSGSFAASGGMPSNSLRRLNADGTPDTGFNPLIEADIRTLVLQADGKILVAGYFTSLMGAPRSGFGRLNGDGSLDTGFVPESSEGISSVVLQPDGKILVGGYLSDQFGEFRSGIERLGADGTLDESFNPEVDGEVKAMLVQEDGKILIGGDFSNVGAVARSGLGRLRAGGGLDLGFDVVLGGDFVVVENLRSLDGGRVLVAGSFSSIAGQTRHSLARLGPASYEAGTDYVVERSFEATVTRSGSGYAVAPLVELVGGGGSGALAEATLSAGVQTVTVSAAGSGYGEAPSVAFVGGGGTGAGGFASVRDGRVTDVTVTNPGSGYSSVPSVVFSGGGGVGAVAEAKIVGGVGGVAITAGGSGYTAVPVMVFRVVNEGKGSGAEAVAQLDGGAVTGVDVVVKLPGSTIGESAQIRYLTTTPTAPGTADGVVSTTVTSTSKVVTLNGKSYVSTRRVHSGEGAAAGSNFPVRLIVHSAASGEATLMQQAYLGSRDGSRYVGAEEVAVAVVVKGALTVDDEVIPAGSLGRVSSASFPRGGMWEADSGSFDSQAVFTVDLGHDAESNPFVHTFHPDHDNWDARYESPLGSGNESYRVVREITLRFSAERPAGISATTWGVTTLGGTYTEVISGLRAGAGIVVSGPFVLQQVSEAATLTTQP